MGRWLGSVFEAARLAKGIFALIVAVWCVLPVMVEWVLHPSDVIRLVHYLEGEAIRSISADRSCGRENSSRALRLRCLACCCSSL